MVEEKYPRTIVTEYCSHPCFRCIHLTVDQTDAQLKSTSCTEKDRRLTTEGLCIGYKDKEEVLIINKAW